VTWNGRGYDLPVLRQRAFIKGVPTPRWFKAGNRYESYGHRYSEQWHCDLMDQLSDYGACAKTGMDLMAKATGLPGKINGSGAEVEEMFQAGEIERIASYCECDVLNLYGLYLRWLLVTGQTDGPGYHQSLEEFVSALEASGKPHHASFLAGWRRERSHADGLGTFRSEAGETVAPVSSSSR
jgi:3'-5' exonuclease